MRPLARRWGSCGGHTSSCSWKTSRKKKNVCKIIALKLLCQMSALHGWKSLPHMTPTRFTSESFWVFFSSDLFATVRGPSAQARPRPSPGPRKGDQGSPQRSKAGKASLDARAAGKLAAASCARGGGWAKAHQRDDLRARGHLARAAAERARKRARSRMNLSGFGAPPAAKLEGEDNEAAARGAEKLGIRSPLFGKASVPKGSGGQGSREGTLRWCRRQVGLLPTTTNHWRSLRGGGHLGDRRRH